MRIQIDGVGTTNKGAELMLYSILEQIEKTHPDSIVILNSNSIGFRKIITNLKLIKPIRLKYSHYIRAILKKLNLPNVFFTNLYPLKKIDLVLDASGFKYGDQWNYSNRDLKLLEKYYSKLKHNNTKIIMLPQAFGPFEKSTSRTAIGIINKYVDIIIARDELSFSYLIKEGIEQKKILQYPDFTITTRGTLPQKYANLKGGICIIPNKKMLTHAKNSKEELLQFYRIIYNKLKNENIFLLNHEGRGDYNICRDIRSKLNIDIPIITNLNAKEIKGVIKESKLVISSRYHGVISALNQAVPCYATSWSHKYELLLRSYGLENNILDIKSDPKIINNKINYLLTNENQRDIREKLEEKSHEIKLNIEEMWRIIWNSLNN